jgi:hypothetical protein
MSHSYSLRSTVRSHGMQVQRHSANPTSSQNYETHPADIHTPSTISSTITHQHLCSEALTALIFTSSRCMDSQNDGFLPTILKHFQNICTIQMLLTYVMLHCQTPLLTNSTFPEQLSPFCNRISRICVVDQEHFLKTVNVILPLNQITLCSPQYNTLHSN